MVFESSTIRIFFIGHPRLHVWQIITKCYHSDNVDVSGKKIPPGFAGRLKREEGVEALVAHQTAEDAEGLCHEKNQSIEYQGSEKAGYHCPALLSELCSSLKSENIFTL